MWCDSPWWTGIGLGVTVVGAALSWNGMLQTWRQHGGGNLLVFLGLGSLPEIRDRTLAAGRHERQKVFGFLRLSRGKVEIKYASDGGQFTDKVDEVLTQPPMPGWSVSAQTAWLEDHVQRLWESLRVLDNRTRQEDQRLDDAIAELKQDQDQKILDVAVSGLPRQATGLLLVTLGALIAAVPSLCPLFHAATSDDVVSHALAHWHIGRR